MESLEHLLTTLTKEDLLELYRIRANKAGTENSQGVSSQTSKHSDATIQSHTGCTPNSVRSGSSGASSRSSQFIASKSSGVSGISFRSSSSGSKNQHEFTASVCSTSHTLSGSVLSSPPPSKRNMDNEYDQPAAKKLPSPFKVAAIEDGDSGVSDDRTSSTSIFDKSSAIKNLAKKIVDDFFLKQKVVKELVTSRNANLECSSHLKLLTDHVSSTQGLDIPDIIECPQPFGRLLVELLFALYDKCLGTQIPKLGAKKSGIPPKGTIKMACENVIDKEIKDRHLQSVVNKIQIMSGVNLCMAAARKRWNDQAGVVEEEEDGGKSEDKVTKADRKSKTAIDHAATTKVATKTMMEALSLFMNAHHSMAPLLMIVSCPSTSKYFLLLN
jgi:hypothetical protein